MIRFAELFFFLDIGGVEKNIVQTVNLLPNSRFEKSIILSHHTGILASTVEPFTKITLLPQENRMYELVQVLREYDACHCHTVNLNPFWIWAAAMAEVPVILNSIESTVSFPYSAYVNYTICIAHFVREMQSRLKSIEVLPNATFPKLNIKAPIDDGNKIVLIEISRPQKEKLFSLEELYPHLKSVFPEIECWIIGREGQSKESLKFFGKVPDVGQYLQNAHFLCHFPSHEVISLAILEAMAHGVIPIVSAVGGNLEMIRSGENGYIIETGIGIQDTVNQISRILHAYRNNPETFAQLRRRIQLSIQEEFNIHSRVSRFERIIIRELEKSKAGVMRPPDLKILVSTDRLKTRQFLNLLEIYCFSRDEGIKRILEYNLNTFSPEQHAFLLGILGYEALISNLPDDAYGFLQRAIALWEEEFYLNLHWAMILKARGEIEAAIPYFEKAHHINPDEMEPLINLVECFLSSGEIDKACEIARNILPDLPLTSPLKSTLKVLLQRETAVC